MTSRSARLTGRSSASRAGPAPAQCIAGVNETLCAENPLDMFVTLFYAEFDEATGEVADVNAGHCEPVIAGAGGARLLAVIRGVDALPRARCNRTISPVSRCAAPPLDTSAA